VTTKHWTVRLSAAAEVDFAEIVAWTTQHFGPAQARLYASILRDAVTELAAGPKTLGAKARPDVGAGLHTLHVARRGRRGSHVVLFRIAHAEQQPVIEVLRMLHESMDFARQVPSIKPREGAE
jgi:toxin ParE1/3/4